MRWLIGLTAWLILACANAPEATAPDATTAAPVDARPEGITRRRCGRPEFEPGWTIKPTSPGVTCRSRADCGSDPLTYCIGLADCVGPDADSCKTEAITSTFCRTDDCASDTDCSAGRQCVCPETGGDPWCVKDGCDKDSDCADGQHCASDDAVQGVGPVQHCSTPDDLCTSSSDCTEPNKACGYDASARRWACGDIFTVD